MSTKLIIFWNISIRNWDNFLFHEVKLLQIVHIWIKYNHHAHFFIFKANLNYNLKIHYLVHDNIQKKNQDNNHDLISVYNENDNNFTMNVS